MASFQATKASIWCARNSRLTQSRREQHGCQTIITKMGKKTAGFSVESGSDRTIIIYDQSSVHDQSIFIGGHPSTGATRAEPFHSRNVCARTRAYHELGTRGQGRLRQIHQQARSTCIHVVRSLFSEKRVVRGELCTLSA